MSEIAEKVVDNILRDLKNNSGLGYEFIWYDEDDYQDEMETRLHEIVQEKLAAKDTHIAKLEKAMVDFIVALLKHENEMGQDNIYWAVKEALLGEDA